jgi:hypothetical protein
MAAEGETVDMTGVGAEPTVNGTMLLTSPSKVVTTTGPVVAPVGTATLMLVLFQVVVDARKRTPLNVTVPPEKLPKFRPLILTNEPTFAKYGFIALIVGETS